MVNNNHETRIDLPQNSHKSNNNNCHKLYNNIVTEIFLITILIIFIPILSSFLAIIAFPFLIISLLVTRLIQFFKYDENGYIKAFQIKLIIRNALFIDVLLILLGLGLFVLVCILFDDDHKMTKSKEKSVTIISTLCGFYLFSFLVLKLVHRVLLKKFRTHIVEAISEITDCSILLCARLVLTVQIKNDEYVYYYYYFKDLERYCFGIAVIIGYVIGYNLITMFTHFLVFGVSMISRPKNQKGQMIFEKLSNKYLVYYAKGLKWSIDFVLGVLLLLIVWVKFKVDLFPSDENVPVSVPTPAAAPIPFQVNIRARIQTQTQAPAPGPASSVLKDLVKGKDVWGFVAWSLVSLLICGFFWLFKTVILLAWKANTVYERLYDKIINHGKELYYLCAFGEKFGIFKLQDLGIKEEMEKILLRDENVKGYKPSMDEVKSIAQYFLLARFHLNKKEFISDILEKLPDPNDEQKLSEVVDKIISAKEKTKDKSEKQATRISSAISLFGYYVYAAFSFICSNNIKPSTKTETLCPKKEGEEENFSLDKIKGKEEIFYVPNKEENKCGKEDSAQSQSEEKIYILKLISDRQQVVRVHSRCMILANTLSNAQEVASCLNNIIVLLIIVATFIIWLLLTKLATRDVIFFFGSSLLAGTFIFGNTCKTLFQSILFVFIVHPFDVADLCVVDDILMEVKDIGIWKTTFSKVGCQEEVIYPNTQLSNKKIINHKSDIDWNDHVELEVSSLDKEKIFELQEDIEKYLNGDKANFIAGYNCVEIKECPNGNNLKAIIDFKHNTNLQNSTYFEYVKEKRKRRSKFVLYIQDLVNTKQISGLDNLGQSDDATCSNKSSPLESTKEQPDDDDGGDDEKGGKKEKKSEDEGGEEDPKHNEGCDQEKEKCCNCPKCIGEKAETNKNGNKDKEANKEVSEISGEQTQSDNYLL